MLCRETGPWRRERARRESGGARGTGREKTPLAQSNPPPSWDGLTWDLAREAMCPWRAMQGGRGLGDSPSSAVVIREQLPDAPRRTPGGVGERVLPQRPRCPWTHQPVSSCPMPGQAEPGGWVGSGGSLGKVSDNPRDPVVVRRSSESPRELRVGGRRALSPAQGTHTQGPLWLAERTGCSLKPQEHRDPEGI